MNEVNESIKRVAKQWKGRLDIPSNYTGELMDFSIDVANDYHESMMRWRSLDELPEDGQRIETLMKWNDSRGMFISVGNESSTLTNNHNAMECIGWRPASSLPSEY